MFGYRTPDPDEVMLVGFRGATQEEPYKIYRRGKFIIPSWFPGGRSVGFLNMNQYKAVVEEPCTTTQGINASVKAVVAFRVAPDDKSLYAAGTRFLDDQRTDRKTGLSAMAEQTGQVFAGHLRSIVGAMKLEDIIQKRQQLAEQVLDASETEMAKMGLEVDSFQLTSIGGAQVEAFIAAMAAPHTAKVQQEAALAKATADQATAIAQSKAAQAAAEAEQESQRNQAEFKRQTLVVQAQYQAEVDMENETARQAGPLSAAKAQQAVLAEQELLASRQKSLRAAQLQTEEVAPAMARAQVLQIEADAEAQRAVTTAKAENEAVKLAADAEAHRVEVTAKAMAEEGRVTLDRLLIEQLPQIVESASQTLRGANVTLFNGAEGANSLIAGALTQGLSVFQTVRSSLDKAMDQKDINEIERLANSQQ